MGGYHLGRHTAFVAMSSLNVNRNLHKVVYTKLEKYSAKIDDVCSRLASVFIRLICNRVRNLDTCSTLLIDVLQFIPGEARDLLRIAPRTAIPLPEGRYLCKDFVKVKCWTDRPLHL